MPSQVQSPLRKCRHARGLSLEEVGRIVGIDSGNLSRIELGHSVSRERAARLAAFYAPEIDERHVLYPERYTDWSPKSVRQKNPG